MKIRANVVIRNIRRHSESQKSQKVKKLHYVHTL